MFVHFTRTSSNVKTGPIPVTTTEKASCPDTCGLKGSGCYAEYGPLAMHWRKIGAGGRGSAWDALCDQIKALPRNQLWRHNQAGDLPGSDNAIDAAKLAQLVSANKGKRGFTYTHYPMHGDNLSAVKSAIDSGFTINASADNDQIAMQLHELGLPVAVIASKDKPYRLANGVQVAICPAQKSDHMSCDKCQLCADSNRDYVIGFIPHGTGKKRVVNIARV